MLTFTEIFMFSIGVFAVGIAIAICLAFLYLLVKIIDVKLNIKQDEDFSFQTVQKSSIPKTPKKQKVEDDLPILGPMKVETSFDDKRIGKVESK